MERQHPAAELIELVALVVRSVAGHRDLGLTAISTLDALERHGAQPVSALTEAQGTLPAAMSEMIERLRQRGLVDVADGPDPVAHVTRTGRVALEAQRRRSRERVDWLLDGLPPADVRALADALAAVLPALRERLAELEGDWA